MGTDPAWSASSYSVMGDTDRSEFKFNQEFTLDELTELLERNPRMAMLCDWMVGEALKNGWEWDQDEMIEWDEPNPDPLTIAELPTIQQSVSKDDYLELIKGYEKIQRLMMFARLHGTAIAVLLDENEDLSTANPENAYFDFAVYHRTSGGLNGWKILEQDLDEKGNPKFFTIYIHPATKDDGAGAPKMEPRAIKVTAERVVVFKNPKKGERWGGTPSSKLIAHTCQLEELLIKLMGKHSLNIVDAFWHIKNVKNQEQADSIHSNLAKKPLDELYTNGVEMEPMRLEIQGSAADFDMMINILKDYMACAMRVSRQSMDGAPEGTLSSAEYNTIISYSVIEQIQTHYKPYMEELFGRLGFKNPNFEWIDPMKEMQEQANANNPDGDKDGSAPERPSA